MKRIFILTIASILMLSLMLLSGCDINKTTDGDTHTHAFGEWKTTKEPSCTEDGIETRTCSCGESEKETISAFGHTEETVPGTPATCTESGLTDGKKCTVCGEFTVNQEGIFSIDHDIESRVVNDEQGIPITIFTCKRDSCEFIKSEYISGLYDAENNLLATWDELDVGDELNELSGLSDALQKNPSFSSGTTLFIDNSINQVRIHSFEDCPNITTIIIPSSVTSITNSLRAKLVNFNNIIVDENNEHYKSIDGNLYTKDGKILKQYAVGKVNNEFIIPDGVEVIGTLAFGFGSKIENIVIPSSVTQINNSAFYSCASLKNIYFNGTAEEWDAIQHKTNWLPYNALVHYDCNKMFMAYGFAGDFGSSGASGLCPIITIRDSQVFINEYGYDVLYDTTTRNDSYQFEYGDRIYSYIENRKEPEKLAVLDQIKACDQLYILEGTDKNGDLQKRICCYIDGIFYLLTVSDTNEEIGVPIINRINYAIFEWEE